MIRLSLGNVGSGKTLMEVREMMIDPSKKLTFTNIQTKIPHAKLISPQMIVKKVPLVSGRDGKMKYDLKLNVEYWKAIKEPINVVIDEAHIILNPRRSMSKVNVVTTDWLAMIRRVLGQAESGEGNLVLITQLWNRLDVVARDMATQIRYHICKYMKRCKDCQAQWYENSEFPEPAQHCPRCLSPHIIKFNHEVEVFHFANIDDFMEWKISGIMNFYRHYCVSGLEQYFNMYNTLQWENMFSDMY